MKQAANAIEFSRLRAGTASYILRQFRRQDKLENHSGSKSAATLPTLRVFPHQRN